MKHAIVITALCVAAVFVAAVWKVAPVRPRDSRFVVVSGVVAGPCFIPCQPERWTTGNRVDSAGRLNANGDYVLDAQGKPVLVKLEQSRWMKPKQ